MKFMKNVFGEKKKGQLESLVAEAGINSSAVNEEQAKQGRLAKGLDLIAIELDVSPKDADLLKRKKRLETAMNESTTRMSEAQARLSELNAEIAQMRKDQERQRLIDIAEVDCSGYELYYRSKKFEMAVDKLQYVYGKHTGHAGANSPHKLLKDAGVKAGYFDKVESEHAQHHEIWQEMTTETKARVEEEFEVLMEAIDRFLAQDQK